MCVSPKERTLLARAASRNRCRYQKEGRQDSPTWVVLVNKKIGRAFRGKFRGDNGKHVGAEAETVGEQEYIGNSARGHREGSKVVDTNGTT